MRSTDLNKDGRYEAFANRYFLKERDPFWRKFYEKNKHRSYSGSSKGFSNTRSHKEQIR